MVYDMSTARQVLETRMMQQKTIHATLSVLQVGRKMAKVSNGLEICLCFADSTRLFCRNDQSRAGIRGLRNSFVLYTVAMLDLDAVCTLEQTSSMTGSLD
jgi:hypothetical protein